MRSQIKRVAIKCDVWMKYYQQPILTDTAVMKTLDEFGVSKLEVGSNENKQTRYFFLSQMRCTVHHPWLDP